MKMDHLSENVLMRVDELTSPPTVGKTYLVPCVKHPRADIWFPVVGPRHSDAEIIGLANPHYHYDARFIDLDLVRVDVDGLAKDRAALRIAHLGDGEVVYREMVCLRPLPEWTDAPWQSELTDEMRQRYKGRVCTTCPHRGLPLVSTVGGAIGEVVTCPGHGLRLRRSKGGYTVV